MVEIFWNANNSTLPMREQKYFELRLLDLGSEVKPRFLVRELRVSWSDRLQQMVCDDVEDEPCHTPEEAQRRYQGRKAMIIGKGFVHSDGHFPVA